MKEKDSNEQREARLKKLFRDANEGTYLDHRARTRMKDVLASSDDDPTNFDDPIKRSRKKAKIKTRPKHD